MYVMTHKKIAEIPDPIYIPMQVGKAGKEDFGYIGDDTGDNISEKNSSYCELTGMYWLWKNADCDVIGICHYRRYFVKEEKLLTQAYIENLIEDYPIIVSNSSFVEGEDVYDHYGKRHYIKDLDVCRDVIMEKCPKYVAAYDYCVQTILMSVGNMWITRKDIFDRYCAWLFDILFEVEKRIDISDYDDYQGRVMGFLSERLFRVWLMMQPEPITEEKIKLIAPEDFGNDIKRTDLLYRCAKLKVMPVIQLHQTGMLNESLATSMQCADDFEGKIPVWVCWWQGEAEMPELVRLCYNNLKQKLPMETVELRLITLDNCMEYVTFTDAVIRKFNEGKISLTHLSDVLRAELLYRYGGMWIDATYYVTAPLEAELFERELYTIRFLSPIWSSDITKGRWSGNLWIVKRGEKLFQFLMESLWYYWENEEEMIDYYLIDYLLAVAVDEFSDVREKLEQCDFYQGNVFGLAKWMNRKYSAEYDEKIRKASAFYKLNRRENYRKSNLVGEETVYGHFVHSEIDGL